MIYSWVERVISKQLSNRALMLVSRFARRIKQVNGQVINLQDPLLAKQIVLAAQSTNDALIGALFKDILEEFEKLVENPGEPTTSGTKTAADQLSNRIDEPAITKPVTYYRGVPVVSSEQTEGNANANSKITSYRGMKVLVD